MAGRLIGPIIGAEGGRPEWAHDAGRWTEDASRVHAIRLADPDVPAAPDLRLAVAEEGRRTAGGPLEEPAEVEFVVEADLGGDLLDGLERVQEFPLGLSQDAFADQLGQRLVEVPLYQLGEGLR